MRQMQLKARAYHWVLKFSGTVADLAGAEALQFQPKFELM